MRPSPCTPKAISSAPARSIWTELLQKPAGRLVLFLLVGGIFLAFIVSRRGLQPKPDNTPVVSQATQAKSYSFKEDIQPLSRTQASPSPRESDSVERAAPTPKPQAPIPQTIFVTRDQSISEWFLPYGRLLRCELVNTVDSTNIDTPIIGLVIEDAWNQGRAIIPAGTEVHGVANKSPVRERIGSHQEWFLVFQDGRELPIPGSVLDWAPDPKKSDSWAESDGSAGLRGFIVKSDKYVEAKAILASMISAGAGAFAETTTLISPLGGATQLNNGGIDSAFSAGLQAGGQLYSKRLQERLDQDPFYVRVPAGTTFYLYVTQTVDLGKATVGLSASIPQPNNPTNP
jgi:Bacterial conjugation TrbI-like protein